MAVLTIKIERRGGGATRTGSGRRTRAVVLASVAVLAGTALVSGAAAQADVVPIPAVTLAHNVAVGLHRTLGRTVLGATTSVPSDATRVVLHATVTNATANGTLRAYPNQDPGAKSGTLSFSHGGQAVSGTFTERVGAENMVRFANDSNGSIRLTVKAVGYRTDVDASDITATGGHAGDVLTNTGTGAAWRPSGHAYGVADASATIPLNGGSFTTLGTVKIPRGSYVVSFNVSMSGVVHTVDNIGCYLYSPGDNLVTADYGSISAGNDQSVIGGQGLLSTATGGTILLNCIDGSSAATAYAPTVIADSVGTVSGDIASARTHPAGPPGPTAP